MDHDDDLSHLNALHSNLSIGNYYTLMEAIFKYPLGDRIYKQTMSALQP